MNVYMQTTARPTNVVRFPYNDFEYIFDYYTDLEIKGTVSASDTIEDRVVGVIGISKQIMGRQTARWLRGWIGPTEKRFGNRTDKGHFIAHSIGGGLQLNIFPQRRDLNRGWSDAGKRYRAMEKYCFDHPGTLCFNRPIYSDVTSKPSAFDFGFLTEEGSLQVAHFDNSTINDERNFPTQLAKSFRKHPGNPIAVTDSFQRA